MIKYDADTSDRLLDVRKSPGTVEANLGRGGFKLFSRVKHINKDLGSTRRAKWRSRLAASFIRTKRDA